MVVRAAVIRERNLAPRSYRSSGSPLPGDELVKLKRWTVAARAGTACTALEIQLTPNDAERDLRPLGLS
jgi:hypothetical protein